MKYDSNLPNGWSSVDIDITNVRITGGTAVMGEVFGFPLHLRYDMWDAYEKGYKEHPQKVMEHLGITYQYATPQSIADQWWFWNCNNLPKELPKFLSVLFVDPMTCVGNGLSKEEAESIRDYKPE